MKTEVVIGAHSPQLAILHAAEFERRESFDGSHPDSLRDFGIQLAQFFEDKLDRDSGFSRVSFAGEELCNTFQRDFPSLESSARMIDQHLAHRSRGDAEKVILVDDAGLEALQFEEELAYKGGWLKGMARPFATKQGPGDGPQAMKRELVDGIAGVTIAQPSAFHEGSKSFRHRFWKYIRVPEHHGWLQSGLPISTGFLASRCNAADS